MVIDLYLKIYFPIDHHCTTSSMKQKCVYPRCLRSAIHKLKCLYIETFDIQCITELPETLNKNLKNIILNRKDEDEISKQRDVLNQLECTIWKWHQDSHSSYKNLFCLATLSLFGFSLDKFWAMLVSLKFYWEWDIVEFVLSRFSHINIAISYSNSVTPEVFVSSLEISAKRAHHCQEFWKIMLRH